MTDLTPFRPGGLVSAESVPTRLDDDECVLVVREGVGVMCARDHDDHDQHDRELPPIFFADQLIARHGQPMRDAIDRARLRYEADKAAARQPRRRWWHRLTRRNRP